MKQNKKIIKLIPDTARDPVAGKSPSPDGGREAASESATVVVAAAAVAAVVPRRKSRARTRRRANEKDGLFELDSFRKVFEQSNNKISIIVVQFNRMYLTSLALIHQ